MRPRLRRLSVKIFLWFCLTIAVTSVLVVVFASAVGSQPFGARWMRLTQDLYAKSAVDFYTTGGAPSLQAFQDKIRTQSGIDGYLVTVESLATHSDVLGRPVPAELSPILERAQQRNGPVAMLLPALEAASYARSADGRRFLFLMRVSIISRFLDGTFPRALAVRVVVGVLLIGLFCLVLARHITRPVRVLEQAAARLAGGDLSVRTMPSMGDRRDELSVLAGAFDRMAERIEALLRTERQMLADTSHELRSPLTRLAVSLELLRRGQTDVIPAMEEDLERMNERIGQVMAMARLDLQPPPPANVLVDVLLLLQTVRDDANREGAATQKRVELTAGPLVVSGDENMLHSAVENIVRNALEYSPPGATIQLRAMTSGNTARIEVHDAGPGVPEEALSKVFAPFFRLPEMRVAHPDGSGLGLSIAARIAQHHGGRISAANASGGGLIVTVELPLAAQLS